MKNKKNLFLGLTFFLFFLLFFLKGLLFLDPDFGWHLKVGELILSSGIPKADPFSYTMPSFPFVDHEWLTDILIFKLYHFGGFTLLSLVFGLAASGAIFLTSKNFASGFFLLTVGTLLSFAGIRPQVISWFFLALLLRLLSLKQSRKICLWPLLFIFWANLHGGFAIGLVTIFVFLTFKAFRTKKIVFAEVAALGLSVLATVINPYGLTLWHEIWQSFSDVSLHSRIAEWTPTFFNFHFLFLALVASSLLLILRYIKKFYLEELALYFGFLMASFSSQRHVPLWTIVALPLIFKALSFLKEEVSFYKEGSLRLQKAQKVFLGSSLFLLSLWSIFNLYQARLLSLDRFYPGQAVAFLKKNCPEGEIFSYYGWGGYLIWQLPEKKVFIDGRMPSWRRSKRIPGESNYALDDYLKVVTRKAGWGPIFNQYQVKTVLWPVSSTDNLRKQLLQNGWQEIYQDNVASILLL